MGVSPGSPTSPWIPVAPVAPVGPLGPSCGNARCSRNSRDRWRKSAAPMRSPEGSQRMNPVAGLTVEPISAKARAASIVSNDRRQDPNAGTAKFHVIATH